jgi:propanol-preferring alcohol dehydrogenase
MQALQLSEPGPQTGLPLRVVQLDDPEPAADELVIDVSACAVCRTDLQLVEGDLRAHRLPIVPGRDALQQSQPRPAFVQPDLPRPPLRPRRSCVRRTCRS